MPQPFELKFSTNLNSVVGDLKSFLAGMDQAAKSAGEFNAAGQGAADGISAVSEAATANAGAVDTMAGAMAEAAGAASAEAAELARLTELLGSEELARRSMNAQIIDNTVSERASTEATATTAREVQAASVSTRAYSEAMTASATAAMEEGAAQGEVAERVQARIAGLRQYTEAELAARRAQQGMVEGLETFATKAQGLGSMLTMLGLLDPALLRVGIGMQMAGKAAEGLGAKAAVAEGGVAGLAAELAPFLLIAAAVAAAVVVVAEGIHLVSESIKEGAEQIKVDDTLARYLGSLEEAKKRTDEINGLSIHGIAIPTDELDKADEKLTLFSHGALGAADSLKMVADAATGTQKPIVTVAQAVGGLEAALQSGQAPGRYATQLQRMGVITPGVVNQLNNLHKEGASGAVMWETAREAIMRWGGQSAESAKTVEGSIQTMRNTWTVMLRDFGAPIVDSLRPLLNDLSRLLPKLVPLAQEAGKAIGDAIGTVYGLVKNGEFADGLATAIGIGVDRGVLKLLSAFHAAFDTIKGWAAAIFDSIKTSGPGASNDEIASMMGLQGEADYHPAAAPKAAPANNTPQQYGQTTGYGPPLAPDASYGQQVADEIASEGSKLASSIKRAKETVESTAPKFKANTPTGDDDTQPDGKADKGVKDRTKAVDEGKTAEKEYRDAIQATKGLLEAGQLSESQAAARDIQTTREYIATLQKQQAAMNPASEAYQRLTRDIDLARGALIKLKEGEAEYQEGLALTKSRVEAGIISQSQAEAEDNKSITAYIARLRAARAETVLGSAAYQQMTTKINQATAALQRTTVMGSMVQGLKQLANEWTDVATRARAAAVSIANSISSSVSTAIDDAIFKTGNWKQAFVEAGEAIVKTLIEMVIQYTLGRALMSAINAAFGSADESAVSSQASTAATVWAPAAVSASTASYGAAAGAGLIAYVAAMGSGVVAAAAMTGYQGGGFTGHGHDDEAAGIVHRNEFVMSAPAVRHWGVSTLQALSQMRIPVTGPRASLASAATSAANTGGGGGYSPSGRASGPRGARGGSGAAPLHIHYHADERAMERYIKSNPGRHVVLSHVTGAAVQLGIKG